MTTHQVTVTVSMEALTEACLTLSRRVHECREKAENPLADETTQQYWATHAAMLQASWDELMTARKTAVFVTDDTTTTREPQLAQRLRAAEDSIRHLERRLVEIQTRAGNPGA